jgi:hypothetical protein
MHSHVKLTQISSNTKLCRNFRKSGEQARVVDCLIVGTVVLVDLLEIC